MKKVILVIIAGMILSLTSQLSAAEEKSWFNTLKSLRNPFKSLLPTIEEIQEEMIQPEQKTPSRPTFDARHPKGDQPEVKPEKPKMPTLTITGLVWDSDRPQAIINGEVVGVGDTISNVEVIAINKTGIHVKFEEETITISP